MNGKASTSRGLAASEDARCLALAMTPLCPTLEEMTVFSCAAGYGIENRDEAVRKF